MKKIIYTSMTLFFLTSCATNMPLSKQQQELDLKLKQEILAKYKEDKFHFLDHVDVDVYNGIVNLTGEVFQPVDEDAAYSIARDIAGPENVTGAITDSYNE